MKNKKGFSLAETVIALAVIVMVSISALTIVLSSLKSKASMNTKLEAQNFAYNALECFKSSDGYEDFEDLLDELTKEGFDEKTKSITYLETEGNTPQGDETNNSEEGKTQDEEEIKNKTYKYASSRDYTVTIIVSYEPDTKYLDTFEITIIQNGKEIIKLEYERYGK